MPDLPERLRSAVDPVPAVSIADATGIHRRRRRRRSMTAVLASAVVVLGVGTASLATRTTTHQGTVRVGPVASTAPPATAAPTSVLPVGTVVQGSAVLDPDFVDLRDGYGSVSLNTANDQDGGDDGVAATSDGGRTWKVISPPLEPQGTGGVIHLAFSSPEVGYAVVDTEDGPTDDDFTGRLDRTTNGARTWVTVKGINDVGAVAVSATHAYALAATVGTDDRYHPVLWRSVDQGGTWQPAPVPVAQMPLLMSPYGHSGLLIAAGGTGARAQLLTTFDAGATWTAHATPCVGSGWPAPVSAATAEDLWLVCPDVPGAGVQGKDVYRTHDGGIHWTLVASAPIGQKTVGSIPVGGYVNQLTALSDTSAYLGLDRNGLYKSTDGGRTWRNVVSGGDDQTAYNLFGPTTGVALVDGTSWRTTDGRSWVQTP